MNPVALLWIFLGGGTGACLRYIIVHQITKLHGYSQGFPYAILLVNVIGSFIIGAFMEIVSRETFSNYTYLAPFFMVGVLGGFTTFSSFSLETLSLIEAGKFVYAACYIIGSVAFSIFAAYLGYILAR